MPLSVLSRPSKQISTRGLVMLDKDFIPSSSWRTLADFFPGIFGVSTSCYQGGIFSFRLAGFLGNFGVVITLWAKGYHKSRNGR